MIRYAIGFIIITWREIPMYCIIFPIILKLKRNGMIMERRIQELLMVLMSGLSLKCQKGNTRYLCIFITLMDWNKPMQPSVTTLWKFVNSKASIRMNLL
ncbi:hypothetical protein CXU21_00965 [Akkermansia muciniphila]|nr:hypothetical protein CXU21_00965 [Akkermansia muciniphila]